MASRLDELMSEDSPAVYKAWRSYMAAKDDYFRARAASYTPDGDSKLGREWVESKKERVGELRAVWVKMKKDNYEKEKK